MLSLLKYFSNKKSDYVFAYNGGNNPQWTPCKYSALSKEGYQKNVFVYRAINLISSSIASIPMSVELCQDENVNTFLKNFLKRPNKYQTLSVLTETLVNYLLVSGNAFLHCDSENNIQCLRSDRVKIVPNSTKTEPLYYVYSVDTTQIEIDRDDILHLKLFHTLNDWYGLSPLQVASQAIDQYNEMSKHNISVLQNGGRPSGCLIVKNSENLTVEQKEQLRADVQSIYSGASNSGRIMILEGGLEWKEMGMTLKDLDFNEGKNLTAREIAQAFGIPPVLMGVKGDTAFTSYKEARLHFWEDTVLPLAEMIRAELNSWLSQKCNQSIEIAYDLDGVPALSSRREMLWHKISSANFLTINEKRKILGYPPLEGQDNI